MNLGDLKTPFKAKDIEWRVQSAGAKKGGQPWAMVLAYVTNRAIMDRLDETCGPENWKNERFEKGPDGGILCGISIKCGDEWVTKWDGAENTAVESVKGGLSSAMKRAAVQWGIGRYLYNLDATFATISASGEYWQKGKEGKYDAFNWDSPSLPQWALPEGEVTKKDDYKKADTETDPYVEDKVLPPSEKKYYLEHPDLSDKQKEYLVSRDLMESLKHRIDAQIDGTAAGQKEIII